MLSCCNSYKLSSTFAFRFVLTLFRKESDEVRENNNARRRKCTRIYGKTKSCPSRGTVDRSMKTRNEMLVADSTRSCVDDIHQRGGEASVGSQSKESALTIRVSDDECGGIVVFVVSFV